MFRINSVLPSSRSSRKRSKKATNIDLIAAYLFGINFLSEHGGNIFLQTINLHLPHYTVWGLQARRPRVRDSMR
jgi:hypothetical protein